MAEFSEKNNYQRPTSSFLNGVFLGAVAGISAFFLFGTKKGKVQRKKLLSKIRSGLDYWEKFIEEAEEKKEELAPKVKKITSDLKKNQNAINKLKKKFFSKAGKILK